MKVRWMKRTGAGRSDITAWPPILCLRVSAPCEFPKRAFWQPAHNLIPGSPQISILCCPVALCKGQCLNAVCSSCALKTQMHSPCKPPSTLSVQALQRSRSTRMPGDVATSAPDMRRGARARQTATRTTSWPCSRSSAARSCRPPCTTCAAWPRRSRSRSRKTTSPCCSTRTPRSTRSCQRAARRPATAAAAPPPTASAASGSTSTWPSCARAACACTVRRPSQASAACRRPHVPAGGGWKARGRAWAAVCMHGMPRRAGLVLAPACVPADHAPHAPGLARSDRETKHTFLERSVVSLCMEPVHCVRHLGVASSST